MRKSRDCPALLRNTAAPAGFKHYNQFAPMGYQKDGGRFPNAAIQCNGFLVLQFCEEHHGLPFSLIEASLNVGVSRLFCRVLEEKISMMQVTSGGGEPSMTMQSVAWSACSGVEAHEYYV